MPPQTCPTNVSVRTFDELRVFLFCLAVLGSMACCSQANAQCHSCGTTLPSAQAVGHGAFTRSTYYAPSYAQPFSRGLRSRFGYTEFAHYDTPRGVNRRIPGETFPVQTVVANFTPPRSYSSPRQTSFRKNAFGRSVISRW